MKKRSKYIEKQIARQRQLKELLTQGKPLPQPTANTWWARRMRRYREKYRLVQINQKLERPNNHVAS